MRFCDGVIGNSSSGIVEAPSLFVPIINIGNRQKGRIAAESVLHISWDEEAMRKAFSEIRNEVFRSALLGMKNPYKVDGGLCSLRVKEILKNTDFKKIIFKNFYDLVQSY
jgi:UDP-N-acetylglucosamine 2-epimerase